ncbi:Acetyl-coenzyme A synthetase (Acetate--CoA ligase) (Acyl-activating enzyme) [Magnetospirillum gryphiswaldense MSR-1 v2]|uniref:Acetate--CoA ligase n=1 Tax=Magnetospirillum gryphiswaldense (strain DSM 6361 / JCM 21280 / NBRC 15271 / MSR-1) TaxID=431944 RepID=V6F3H4_MAGGM|nr:acetate--CoA ligase [Magnetospirillum gryphiswaldense]CDL00009.1 Acetyl-coenzyme A synthetase (Acetate--CoA ligase) (Acyl-activating enzyme) [Magnetospirillum gryphiswaldense MSR-1 v2]
MSQVFPVPAGFAEHAHVDADTYARVYARSIENPDEFWRDQAGFLDWMRPFSQVSDTKFDPDDLRIRWFADGSLNASVNALDRHLPAKADQPALLWEGDGVEESRVVTWGELSDRVNRLANVLKGLGVAKGDVVTIYLPVIPEAFVAMLACVRLGAVHSVVFSGFSAEALADRIHDAGAKVLITADEGKRGGRAVPLKVNADRALNSQKQVHSVVVVRRSGADVPFTPGRDHWYDAVLDAAAPWCEPVEVGAEDPLFILYTSGSTGKPKGLVHTTGGYLVHAGTSWRTIFDWHENDVFWCTADVGWVTAHTYKVYGPLLNGATSVLFEGVPTWPDVSRWWSIIAKHKVNIFYTAPTAIRSLMREGEAPVSRHDLSSLRVLGSVGEPINPEAWLWFHRVIGGGRCPIVDTYWQTETGAVLLVPIPGATPNKPGHAAKPYFGIRPELVDAHGNTLDGPGQGNMCFAGSWPGQARTILHDHDRFVRTYFAPYPGRYFTGDGGSRDEDGYYRIMGRVDDVINVSGHRLGTVELESAISSHPAVAESAVVGYPHDIKGQGVFAYVTLKEGFAESDALRREIIEAVRTRIGPIATPDAIQWAPALPKNRAGKILRRILTKVAAGDYDNFGDTSTLADPQVVDDIVQRRRDNS